MFLLLFPLLDMRQWIKEKPPSLWKLDSSAPRTKILTQTFFCDCIEIMMEYEKNEALPCNQESYYSHYNFNTVNSRDYYLNQ